MEERKAKGLSYIDENLEKVAEEYYSDKRVENILSTKNIPKREDLSVIDDMINKLKSL